MYNGIGASSGIGIGRVMIIKEQALSYAPTTDATPEQEIERYKRALNKFVENTMAKAEQMKSSVGEKEAEIIMGHAAMLQDPYMNSEIEKQMQSGSSAEKALETICDMFITMFESTGDELTMQRATDVKDIKKGMLSVLLGIEEADISKAPKGTIIVVDDLTPSMTTGIVKENIAGIITQTGGKTSHSAILARALEIPAVLSVAGVVEKLADGQQVIIDGSKGTVIDAPTEKQLKDYTEKRNKFLKEKEELKKYIGMATATADGRVVELVGNIGNPDNAKQVVECDGEGVGLFRTEFLFMDSDSMPTEEQQFEAYKKAALVLKDKPLIIRTLDIGGDKEIPYLGLKKEENPFLGFRAVRFCLENTQLYKTQLRALLRASAFGNIKIMVPLVTCVDEIRAVKALVKEIMADLDSQGIAYNKEIQVGVMMETSASVMVADLLAKEADFFSIGTNDLTQYTMCVDRGNADVAYLYSVYNPAVLRAIKHIIECGSKEGIMVGMCGEAAADPLMIPLLVAFGLSEFSVSATSVLATRKVISMWTQQEAQQVAQRTMQLETEKEVEEYLRSVQK
ncbi:phosphoenolpyruvate-protein phosphotransferase [Clostridium sp. CAG:964]|nr:phosphoenolpyruvate-protein phosphotransferase [Clostridium sp. CAG:964]